MSVLNELYGRGSLCKKYKPSRSFCARIYGTSEAMKMTKEPTARATLNIIIRPFKPDDVDFVISRQLALYEREYGFTSEIWIAYLTNGVRNFVNQFDSKRDCMYILDNNGVPLGCIAITHVDEATAQLRFFFLEPEIRGLGAGRKLIDQAIEFCKEKKYRRVFLWTFSTLMAARHLYSSKGFQITEMQENRDWGEPVLEERWDLNF